MSAQGQHPDQGSRTGRDWKRERIKDFLLQGMQLGGVSIAALLLFGAQARAGIALIEHPPAQGGDHNAARQLDDGERDSEEVQNGRPQELDNPRKMTFAMAMRRAREWYTAAGASPTRPRNTSAEPSGLMSGSRTLNARKDADQSAMSPSHGRSRSGRFGQMIAFGCNRSLHFTTCL